MFAVCSVVCRLTLPACGAWTATTQDERLRSEATNSVAALGGVTVEGRSSCIGRLPGGGWRATPRPYGRAIASPHRVCFSSGARAAFLFGRQSNSGQSRPLLDWPRASRPAILAAIFGASRRGDFPTTAPAPVLRGL